MNNWLRCIEKEGSSPNKPSEENLLHASSFNKSSENVVFLSIETWKTLGQCSMRSLLVINSEFKFY